jgi:hypothetical protein
MPQIEKLGIYHVTGSTPSIEARSAFTSIHFSSSLSHSFAFLAVSGSPFHQGRLFSALSSRLQTTCGGSRRIVLEPDSTIAHLESASRSLCRVQSLLKGSRKPSLARTAAFSKLSRPSPKPQVVWAVKMASSSDDDVPLSKIKRTNGSKWPLRRQQCRS